MPYFLSYVSAAWQLMSTEELRALLTSCRANNTKAGVTGALLYQDGSFMQVLEGDKDTVTALFTKIGRDPRHHDVTFMVDGTTLNRQFDEWSMAFKDLTAEESSLAEGYSRFMQTRPWSTAYGPDPTIGQRLLLSFRRTLGAQP